MFNANTNTTFLAAAAAANDPQNSSLICTHPMEEITSHHLDFEDDHFLIPAASTPADHEASKETTTTTTSSCPEALTAIVSENPFISSHENKIIMTSNTSVAGSCWEPPRSSSCAAHHYIQPNDVKRTETRNDAGFKIAFRTKSDLEIMDDGYRWRKYGKKMVKNSSNPRNYYRCSTGGCKVKKRVERETEDPRFVITTYEGRHNHESPSPATPTCHTINVFSIPSSSHSLQILRQP